MPFYFIFIQIIAENYIRKMATTSLSPNSSSIENNQIAFEYKQGDNCGGGYDGVDDYSKVQSQRFNLHTQQHHQPQRPQPVMHSNYRSSMLHQNNTTTSTTTNQIETKYVDTMQLTYKSSSLAQVPSPTPRSIMTSEPTKQKNTVSSIHKWNERCKSPNVLGKQEQTLIKRWNKCYDELFQYYDENQNVFIFPHDQYHVNRKKHFAILRSWLSRQREPRTSKNMFTQDQIEKLNAINYMTVKSTTTKETSTGAVVSSSDSVPFLPSTPSRDEQRHTRVDEVIDAILNDFDVSNTLSRKNGKKRKQVGNNSAANNDNNDNNNNNKKKKKKKLDENDGKKEIRVTTDKGMQYKRKYPTSTNKGLSYKKAKTWDEQYDLISKYYCKEHNSIIYPAFPPAFNSEDRINSDELDEHNRVLTNARNWLSRQRGSKVYQKKKLSQVQQEKLKAIDYEHVIFKTSTSTIKNNKTNSNHNHGRIPTTNEETSNIYVKLKRIATKAISDEATKKVNQVHRKPSSQLDDELQREGFHPYTSFLVPMRSNIDKEQDDAHTLYHIPNYPQQQEEIDCNYDNDVASEIYRQYCHVDVSSTEMEPSTVDLFAEQDDEYADSSSCDIII